MLLFEFSQISAVMSLIISGGDIGELHAQLQQPPGSVMAIPASSFVQAGLTSGVGQVKIEGATSFIQGLFLYVSIDN